jgi:hypothetical protein
MPDRDNPHRPGWPARACGPALLLAGMAASVGCRYQDLSAAGALAPAPFSGLECFETGNPEGFSFEVPACECAAGLRLRYYARMQPSPSDVHFEFETNFLDDDPTDDVRMLSRSMREVERLIIGGRELPAYEASSGLDRAQWELAQASFASMMHNYAPVFRRVFGTCAEDRLERETQARLREARR